MVTHARQVLDTTTTNQDHRVFLQVMAFAAYVTGHFMPIGQAYTANFA